MSPARLLLIEDQLDLSESIWDYFEARGHLIDHAVDGANGLRMALKDSFDVIVLDLGLPRLDGLSLCRELRAAGKGTPVLMLTARDTLADKLRGFAEGADDYLVKPFAMAELKARIDNLHRRKFSNDSGVWRHGPLELDIIHKRVSREGTQVTLTELQTRLLAVLLREAPAVVRREQLLYAGWAGGETSADALHGQVHELRNLVDRPFGQRLIHTVFGIGYRIAATLD